MPLFFFGCHTVNKVLLHIDNMLILEKVKLQKHANETFIQFTGGILNSFLNNMLSIGNTMTKITNCQ